MGRGGAGQWPEREPAPDQVAASAELIRQGLAALAGTAPWSLPDDRLRDAVVELSRLASAVEAARLRLLRELDDRPEAVPGARRGRVGVTFLVHALRTERAQAFRDVAAARALDPAGGRLPVLGAALSDGRVSRAHVDVAVRAVQRIPAHLLDRADGEGGTTGAHRVDRFLTEQAQVLSPRATDVVARQLLAVLDPDGSDRFDPVAYTRRCLTCATDATGMLVGRFQLDPAGGAIVQAALAGYAAPDPTVTAETVDGQRVPAVDERTHGQRMADALVTVARLAAARPVGDGSPADGKTSGGDGSAGVGGMSGGDGSAGVGGTSGGDGSLGDGSRGRGRRTVPPAVQVLVVASPEQVVGGAGLADCLPSGPIARGTVARLACDAVLQAVYTDRAGAVLDLGRAVRTVSAAQRKALSARDRGCVIPGCAAPVAACEAHHVRHWREGGASDLANLALTCGHHHDAVHAGIWTIVMRDGVPWAAPPAWVDPTRTPRRHSVAVAADQARRLGDRVRGPDDRAC